MSKSGKADVLFEKSAFFDFFKQNLAKKAFYTEGVVLLIFLGATIFIKAIATSVTLGAGGNGGNFAHLCLLVLTSVSFLRVC